MNLIFNILKLYCNNYVNLILTQGFDTYETDDGSRYPRKNPPKCNQNRIII